MEGVMTEVESQQLITTLYVAAFGRAPDKDGLTYWSGQLKNGFSFDDLIASFLTSNEGKSLYGDDVSDAAFFTNFYGTVLNRSPDAAGAAYWQDRLADLGSRKDLVKEMIFSIKGGKGDDHQLLQNKVDAGLNFANSLSGNNLTYAKSLLLFVTSDANSVAVAGGVNSSWDYPPRDSEQTFLALNGKNLEAEFFYPPDGHETQSFVVGNGTEVLGLGHGVFDIDARNFGVKLQFSGADSWMIDGAYLVLTDKNDQLPSFQGVVLNSAVIEYEAPEAKPFDETKFTVTDNAITIDLSGIHLIPGQSIDFSIFG